MAVYKGREVQVLGPTNGEDTSRLYDILDQWNQRSSVKLNELQFTGEEIEVQKKAQVDYSLGFNKIEAKELQELKDGQDKQKIEAKQGKVTPGPVKVSEIYVDPTVIPAPVISTPAPTPFKTVGNLK